VFPRGAGFAVRGPWVSSSFKPPQSAYKATRRSWRPFPLIVGSRHRNTRLCWHFREMSAASSLPSRAACMRSRLISEDAASDRFRTSLSKAVSGERGVRRWRDAGARRCRTSPSTAGGGASRRGSSAGSPAWPHHRPAAGVPRQGSLSPDLTQASSRAWGWSPRTWSEAAESEHLSAQRCSKPRVRYPLRDTYRLSRVYLRLISGRSHRAHRDRPSLKSSRGEVAHLSSSVGGVRVHPLLRGHCY
jgi:hypothetical protein